MGVFLGIVAFAITCVVLYCMIYYGISNHKKEHYDD